MTAAAESREILSRLGVADAAFAEAGLPIRSPIDGSSAGAVVETEDLDAVVARAATAFQTWKRVPAPRRGELVRLLGFFKSFGTSKSG